MEIKKRILRSNLFLILLPFIFVVFLLPPTVLAQEGDEKWSFETGGSVIFSPVIGSNGAIYVGSYDTNVYAINPDGTLNWIFNVPGGGISSSPAIGSDGTIYVGSYDTYIYAINPDGTQKWAFRTGGAVISSAAVGSDGTIYVGSGYPNDKFYAINHDGSEKWTLNCPISWSSPAIGLQGEIYFGSQDGYLYAVNANGTLRWKFDAGNIIYASPAIGYDGTIYVGADYGKFYAINPDGSINWVYNK
jgi:outer membrane protein assembly factor BamB